MRRIHFGTLFLVLALALCGCDRSPSQHDHGDHDDHAEHAGHDKHDDHAEAVDTVRLTPEAIARTKITLGKVKAEKLVGGVDVPAEIQLNPDRTAHITPLISGRIEQASASLGDRVKKQQVLAKLRSVTLGETRSNIASARAAVQVAQATFKRQEELQREGIGSRRAFLAAKGELMRTEAALASARERLRVYGGKGGSGSITSIRSPLDGVIIDRHATPGEVVSTDRPLFVVADLSQVWVVGRVYEQDVAAARRGASAIVSLQAYPGRTWEGVVSYVASTLDRHTRTLSIRVELDNAEGILRPGLFGMISLSPDREAGEAVATVPEQAVQRLRRKTVVFVPAKGEGEFRAVTVTTGARVRGRVELRSGLDTGDRVVTAGAFTLKSELLRGELGDGHAH